MAGRVQQISSFDIFDTVLTRRVADPRALFLVLGRRAYAAGLVTCSPHAFADSRRTAERQAFRNAGGLDSDVTLRTIHEELGDALDLSPDAVDALVEMEQQVELDYLVPLPAAITMVEAARERGREVIFISDMYLSSQFLRDVLDRHGIIQDGETILVSNEVGRSKVTGAMWNYVHNRFPNADIAHCGNDAVSDGRRARRVGVRTLILDDFNSNRYERKLEEYHGATDGLSSMLAGASRIARLDRVGPGDQSLIDVAAGVAAPFVIGNVLWTLQVAKKRGIKKLLFVARDGRVLCDIAELLAPSVGYEGEMIYVYGSRQAWCLASYSEINPAALDALIPIDTDAPATPRQILNRLDMAPEEAGRRYSAEFPAATWNRALSPVDARRLRQLFVDDLDLRGELERNAKNARVLVLDYLEQIGAVTDEPLGLVDLGTGASLFNALSGILATIGQEAPSGFYFGLRSALSDSPFGRPMTYVRDEGRGLGYLSTPGLLTFVELACTAGHGSVIGYRRCDDGVVEPVFASDDNEPAVRWGLPLVHQTIRRVAEELRLEDVLIGSSSVDLRPAIVDVFEMFWNSPTRREAASWGAYPFEDGWGEHAVRNQLAARRWLYHALAPQPHRHWWTGGAKRLSGPLTRAAFDSRQSLRSSLPKAKRRLVG